MGLGVLELATETHVAGTVLLNDTTTRPEDGARRLKHGTGKNEHIVLAPQPTDDPNDPLNWSWFEKHIIISILCFGSIACVAVPGPILSAGTVQVAADLHSSVEEVARSTGYLLVASGSIGPFVSCFARKFGKRPLYVFSSILAVVGCAIAEAAKNYSTLLAGRVIQGLAAAAYESLILASIGDLFFVHERGARVSAVLFILTIGSNAVSIIAGTITAHLGWPYNYHTLMPFVGLQFILVVLFAPETTYRRARFYEIDTIGSNEELEKPVNIETRASFHEEITKEGTRSEEVENSQDRADARQRKKFWKRMAVYNGTFVEDSIIKMLLACPVIMLNVGAFYNIVVSGLLITWSVAMSIISSILWTAPPYSLSAAGVGYVSTGPLIGGILAMLVYGLLADPVIKAMSKRNNGIYEPEFRLPITVVGLVTAVPGLVGFGYACKNEASIYLIAFVWGIMMFGLFISASVTSAYVLDAFREHSTEIFIMSMVFKCFFFYGFSDYGINWLMTQGVSKMCNIMAGIGTAMILTTIPMYVYGKRYRHLWQDHNLIKKWHLETDKTGTEE